MTVIMANPEDPLELPQLDWRYEMRRECQEVLRGIWVGPTDAGKNSENLQRMGITAIVILRTASEALFLKPRFPDLFRYLILNVSDRTDQPLISIYSELRTFIDEQRGAGGNVLIHDEGGMSRAPAMAAMYFIDKKAVSYERAIMAIQYRRYCMHVNSGFIRQLKEFEAMCVARDQIAEYQASIPTGLMQEDTTNRKRRDFADDDEDENEENMISKRGKGNSDGMELS